MTEDRLEVARAFLATHHRAVLITRRADGGLQSSPVAAAVEDSGLVVVSTREGSAKERNVTRDGRVSLCVVSDGWWGPWVHLDGTATVLRLPDALEALVDYYRRVAGEHPNWDEYTAAMRDERRVVLRVHLERASSIARS